MVLQTLAGVAGGTGWLLGEQVGVVANFYPTPILPVPAAFSIWSLIYAGCLALAAVQLLPSERVRPLHRRTGWWLTVAGLANAIWVVLFTSRLIFLAQLVIVVLLVSLAVPFHRLAVLPPQGWRDRILVQWPISVYAGWVSIATVVGAASTGVAAGGPRSSPVAVAAGTIVVLATAALVAWVIARSSVVVPYAAAVGWGLLGIAVTGRAVAVAAAACVAVVAIAVAVVLRLRGASTDAASG